MTIILKIDPRKLDSLNHRIKEQVLNNPIYLNKLSRAGIAGAKAGKKLASLLKDCLQEDRNNIIHLLKKKLNTNINKG